MDDFVWQTAAMLDRVRYPQSVGCTPDPEVPTVLATGQ